MQPGACEVRQALRQRDGLRPISGEAAGRLHGFDIT